MLNTPKRDELAKRRSIENTLFSIGLTKADVASCLNIDEGSVLNDYRILGGDNAYPYRTHATPSELRIYAYRTALDRYIDIDLFDKKNRGDLDNGVHAALGKYLDMPRWRGMADGFAPFVELMLNPPQSPEWIGYKKLLYAIFGERTEGLTGAGLLRQYFEYLRINHKSHSTAHYPTRDSFPQMMAEWVRFEFACRFSPMIGETTFVSDPAI